MSSSTYAVEISNNWRDGAEDRRYCVFPEAAKITGAGGQASTVRRTFHAFIGRVQSEWVAVGPGHFYVLPGKKLYVSYVRSEMDVPVKLGSDMRNGSCLDAEISELNGRKLKHRTMEAQEGSFEIRCTEIKPPATAEGVWVGLAQTINNIPVAVCGVPFVPRATYTITPVADSIRVALAPEFMKLTLAVHCLLLHRRLGDLLSRILLVLRLGHVEFAAQERGHQPDLD
ncbi:hypothetical protein B0T26DRAFT_752925 [Lasiosphaeria miniovina]|uniref:Uncharacterized protein n=1 Tax=Lasiosphaeria miniovina TaxID=1954250 RepID=A0AA40ABA4_9PEZI|nr:uncharacterized protein B0T26DRAFT_752925 [Lasiosphaeria miniovina]KAK0712724.1 hypothetical protein B0T26DRAFT_752925 [Lasiosphaeria miniovina]